MFNDLKTFENDIFGQMFNTNLNIIIEFFFNLKFCLQICFWNISRTKNQQSIGVVWINVDAPYDKCINTHIF